MYNCVYYFTFIGSHLWIALFVSGLHCVCIQHLTVFSASVNSVEFHSYSNCTMVMQQSLTAEQFLTIVLGSPSPQKAEVTGVGKCQDSNCFEAELSWQFHWRISEVLYHWRGIQKGVHFVGIYRHACIHM